MHSSDMNNGDQTVLVFDTFSVRMTDMVVGTAPKPTGLTSKGWGTFSLTVQGLYAIAPVCQPLHEVFRA